MMEKLQKTEREDLETNSRKQLIRNKEKPILMWIKERQQIQDTLPEVLEAAKSLFQNNRQQSTKSKWTRRLRKKA